MANCAHFFAARGGLGCGISQVAAANQRNRPIHRATCGIFILCPTEISGFDDLLGHSITYRIALGPHQGRKAFTLQTVPAVAAADDNSSLAKAAGFSLHAGVASEADEREKLERLCRHLFTQSMVRREHAVIARKINSWRRHQRGQAGHEV